MAMSLLQFDFKRRHVLASNMDRSPKHREEHELSNMNDKPAFGQ